MRVALVESSGLQPLMPSTATASGPRRRARPVASPGCASPRCGGTADHGPHRGGWPGLAGPRADFTTGLGTPVEPRNVNRRWDSQASSTATRDALKRLGEALR